MRTEYIGRDVNEIEIVKSYQEEVLFYGCYFDTHCISEINCKAISFVGCFFHEDIELSNAIFKKISFKNCFFCESLEIHLPSDITSWKDCITIDDDSDCKITIYKNNKFIIEKVTEVLPRQFKDFVLLRHYEADRAYENLNEIYQHYIENKQIDCTPIFSGLITEAYDVIKRDTIQHLLSVSSGNKWQDYVMQIIFNWVYDQDVIKDISFISNIKPTKGWHTPSFSRIFSNNWFETIDGLQSILRCCKYNSSLLEESFYEKIKHLALHSEKTSIVSYCIQIISMNDKDLLAVILTKRLELIKKITNPEVLALLDSLDKNLSD